MKIKLYFYIFFFIIIHQFQLCADEIFFESENIKIKEEGNMIYAFEGYAKIPSQSIEIEGDRSIYNKLISELTIIDNVKFLDLKKEVYIESEKIIYNQIENTIFSQGKTFIKIEDTYEINSENVFYDRNSMKVSSKKDTTVEDGELNIFNFEEGFLFDIPKELISSKKTNILDNNNNNYVFDKAKVNLKTNEIAGKEVRVDFIDSFFGNKKNDPILKGKSTVSNDDDTKIYKAVFSTCNIENKKCRGWELQSNEFKHDKKKKVFEYRNSWFKVFNKKVLFIPFASHPDPSVKRKSGFLTPVYQSSDNLGKSMNIPYFYVMSDAKDMTFNPRIYSDQDFILQSEYRQAFENSYLIADFSFNRDNENTNTHFFSDLDGNLNDSTAYNLKLQNVTNDNYLKIHNLKQSTPIIADDSVLTSDLTVNKRFDKKTRLRTSFTTYEDLSIKRSSDRYSYTLPHFNFKKDIDINKSYNGAFTFQSAGYQRNYETNKYQAQFNNDFNFNSYDFVSDGGIVNDYDLFLKNYNNYIDTPSSTTSKHDLYSMISLKSKLPLKKELENSTNYLEPKIQFLFSPTKGRDISNENILLNYDNMFSYNRIGQSDMFEDGRSLSIGLEFKKQDLADEDVFSFNIGNVIKDKKNNKLPKLSTLDQSRSDIVGNAAYKINENLKLGYGFSYDRDLEYSNYDAISTEISVNNFVTTFNYTTYNHDLGDSETISNNTKFNFLNDHYILFNTSKNLLTDFTNYYNLTYEYRTDCLSAAFYYNKTFFSNDDLLPEESLSFLIKIIPFAEIRGTANTMFEN